jgi:hypothetical protein
MALVGSSLLNPATRRTYWAAPPRGNGAGGIEPAEPGIYPANTQMQNIMVATPIGELAHGCHQADVG